MSAQAKPATQQSNPADVESVLVVEGLGLRFSGLTVLEGVTFRVQRGETYGIVGPNGAGKTSLLNCLSGTYRPTSGMITLFGKPVVNKRPHTIVGLGVARTFQNVNAFRDMKAIDVVLLGRHSLMRSNPISYALGIPLINGHEREHRAAAEAALEYVGLPGVGDRRVRDLPYGAIKLVDLARTLATESQILLLDEPTSGLSHAERADVEQILIRIRDEGRATQIVIEHNMPLATALCGRLLALASGTCLAEGRPHDVLSDPQVARVFLGVTGE